MRRRGFGDTSDGGGAQGWKNRVRVIAPATVRPNVRPEYTVLSMISHRIDMGPDEAHAFTLPSRCSAIDVWTREWCFSVYTQGFFIGGRRTTTMARNYRVLETSAATRLLSPYVLRPSPIVGCKSYDSDVRWTRVFPPRKSFGGIKRYSTFVAGKMSCESTTVK